MQVNLDEFNKRFEAGLLRKQTLDNLTIWNYSHKCQHDRAWDEYTELARGLITREDGTIHARSFPKFFNLGERLQINDLPNESPVITEKLDGFLGLTYMHKGAVKIASRGSFTSEYALWATEWLHNNNKDARQDNFEERYTYVFEILYPHRRIVVDNSKNYGLVLLAQFDNETGEECSREMLETLGRLFRWPVVKSTQAATLAECVETAKTLKGTESEGYVAHYPTSGVRVKIKGDEYCKIHKIVTRLSARALWEMYVPFAAKLPETDKNIEEICNWIPNEYANWVRKTVTDLKHSAADAYLRTIDARYEVWPLNVTCDRIERRRVVEKLQNSSYNDIFSEVMALIDNNCNKVWNIIWNKLKPVYAVPLLQDGEDE